MFNFLSAQESTCTVAQMRRIERKLDLILRQLGIEDPGPSTALPPEVRELADRGRKIEAIKVYREHVGATLFEAKQAVEEYMAG